MIYYMWGKWEAGVCKLMLSPRRHCRHRRHCRYTNFRLSGTSSMDVPAVMTVIVFPPLSPPSQLSITTAAVIATVTIVRLPISASLVSPPPRSPTSLYRLFFNASPLPPCFPVALRRSHLLLPSVLRWPVLISRRATKASRLGMFRKTSLGMLRRCHRRFCHLYRCRRNCTPLPMLLILLMPTRAFDLW